MRPNITAKEVPAFDKINKALEKEKYDKVIELSLTAIKEFPKQVMFYIVHSIAYSQKGNSAEALKLLMDALNIFPDDYEVLYHIAKVHEDSEKFDKAEEYFKKSFSETPENCLDARSECLNDLGVIMYKKGKEEDAIKLWEKSLEINPGNKIATSNLHYISGDYEDYDDEDYDDEEFDDEDYNSYEEDFELFVYIQQKIYLKDHNREKFISEEEEYNVNKHIHAVWTNKISGQMELMETLDEDQKSIWFNSVHIDYKLPPADIEMPETDDPYLREISEKLSFLPPNGISFLMLAYPFLNAVGINMDDIEDILDEDEISAEDTEKYIWAFEIGERFFKISDSKSETEFKNKSNEIIEIASQRLSKNKARKVFEITMNGMIEGKLPEGIE